MKAIKIFKEARRLEFWQDGIQEKTFSISLGFAPAGGKIREGDGRTPEGEYYICTKNAASKFTLFLGISYPNLEDAKRGLAQGLLSQDEFDSIRTALAQRKRPSWDTPLGGKIGIHGMGTSQDWTAGCIAMEDTDIHWLWERVALGDHVEIYP